jgi:disulfide bond formation protein DsbB
MERIFDLVETMTAPRWAGRLLLAASAIVVGSAVASEVFGGLAPCALCLYQRIPYGVAIALALIAIFVPRLSAPAMALAALAFLAGGGTAVFHVGVEQHWWQGLQSCSGAATAAETVANLRAQLMAAPVVRCDEVQWSLFGVSMAGYNVLTSAALAVFTALAAHKAYVEP